MAENAPNPTPARTRKIPKGKDRRDCDGILKLSVRFHNHKLDGNWNVFSDKRFANSYDRSLEQLRGIIEKPKFKGTVAWAAIYDCRDSRFGPEIFCYKGGQWHSSNEQI